MENKIETTLNPKPYRVYWGYRACAGPRPRQENEAALAAADEALGGFRVCGFGFGFRVQG